MKLIKNWRSALKAYSTMSLAAMTVLVTTWNELPHEVVALIPEQWKGRILIAVALFGLIGRFIDQSKKNAE